MDIILELSCVNLVNQSIDRGRNRTGRTVCMSFRNKIPISVFWEIEKISPNLLIFHIWDAISLSYYLAFKNREWKTLVTMEFYLVVIKLSSNLN